MNYPGQYITKGTRNIVGATDDGSLIMLKKKKVIRLKLRGLQGILIKALDDQSIPVLRVPTGAAGAAAPCGCLEMQP